MQSHPSYPVLAPYLDKYPKVAGSLFQVYNDVVYAQRWTGVQVVDLAGCERVAIKGVKPDTTDTLYAVPCALSETLSFGWLQTAFSQLGLNDIGTALTGTDTTDPPFLYLAITSEDASIVYYKLSNGIAKPLV